MSTSTAGITEEFAIYDMRNDEGWAWTIVRAEKKIPDDKLESFRDAVMESLGWVPERFPIYHYTDEVKFQEGLTHWKKPERSFASVDIEGIIRKPFGDEDEAFEDIRWRRVLVSSSI